MYVVSLTDGTNYNIDTNSEFNARSVVEYKLKNRGDRRRIKSVIPIPGVIADKESKYYNSDSAYDGKELKCTNGWNYKWD